jgi:segregation and condensation protein B
MSDEPRNPAGPHRERLEESAAPQDEEPVSLEKLSQTFARLFAAGDEEPGETAEVSEAAGAVAEAAADAAASAGAELAPAEPPEETADAGEISPRSILEAMLFVGSPDNQPLSAQQAAAAMRGVGLEEVHELVAELNRQYAENCCPYHIISQGAGYRLVLRDEFAGLRDQFFGRVRQARLSQAAIDVLAIVAYNEPLTAEDVNRLRGTPSGAVLTQLVRRQLLRIERPEESPRTPRYFTTQRFLDLFGLQSLDDLPQSQELDPR